MDEHKVAVQRMQDYIQENLYSVITIKDLAKASLYSPWYSYRLFLEYLHMTPAVYVRRMRLSKAALKLRDNHIRIIDVAFEAGFESVDGFQRAFSKEFGCNPYEYSLHPTPIFLFTPYGILYDNQRKVDEKMKEVKNIFITEVERPKRKVILKRGISAEDYWKYGEEVGCDVWGLLLSIPSIVGEPICMWLPKQYVTPGTSIYVQGTEVPMDYTGSFPEGFEIIELPACKYLKFQGEPFAEENFGEAIEEVQQAIHKADLEAMGYTLDRSNPRIQLEPIGTRGYIELIPVLKKETLA